MNFKVILNTKQKINHAAKRKNLQKVIRIRTLLMNY